MNKQRTFFNFQVSEEIKQKLRYLAKKTERSQGGVLRWLIDREYEQHSPTGDNGNQQDGEE